MSGHLRVLPLGTEPKKHDHFDLVVEGGAGKQVLRLHDPRRFGAVLWHANDDGELDQHLLLRGLGVEPLEAGFSGETAVSRQPQAQRAGQAVPAGRRRRGRRRQYLRLRKPVSRRDQSEDQRRPHLAWPL